MILTKSVDLHPCNTSCILETSEETSLVFRDDCAPFVTNITVQRLKDHFSMLWTFVFLVMTLLVSIITQFCINYCPRCIFDHSCTIYIYIYI